MSGFIPSVLADSLYLYIGTAGVGRATALSTTLDNVVFTTLPGQGSPSIFTPDDVGCIIAIVGAGPVDADMPPVNFVQGATFVTTIAAYVSPSQVTLSAAPDTSIYNTGFATVVCFRRCLMASDVASNITALEYDSSIAPGTRDTFNFTALGTDNPYIDRFGTIAMGQWVYLESTDGNVGPIFGGYIDTLTVSNMPGVDEIYSWVATCASWAGLATRRTVGPGTPQVLTGPGDSVFRKVVLDYLIDEGVAVSTSGSPPVITLACAAGAPINNLLDQIVQLISTPDQGWYWTTDVWRTYILAPYGSSNAPWNVTDGYDLLAGDTPYQVSFQSTHNQMANFWYALGTNVLLNALNVTFAGNGSATTFNTPLQIGIAPKATLNGVAQTVGILGVDTGKQWYWNQGSTTITQDSSGTVLTSSDVLVVQYQTETPGVAQAPNVASLQQQQGIEASSGEYDRAVQVSQPIQPADLLDIASTGAAQYGPPATIFSAYTARPGLKTGQSQTIDFPRAGVPSASYLIATIKMTTVNNMIVWQYSAFGGANIGNALTGLVQFINRGAATLSLTTPVPVVGSGYLNSRPIIIDHTQVPSDQVNFPMVVAGTFAFLIDAANGGNVQNPNGYDIIFSSTPDGANPIPFERTTYNGATGDAQFWVSISALSSSVDTVLYICWNNPNISTDQQDPAGVWAPLGIGAAQPNPNYHGVYHLEEASNPYKDSSGYGNDSTGSLDTGYGVQAAGLIGKCQQFNGAQGIAAPGAVMNNGTANTAWSFSAWVKTTQSSDGSIMECMGGAGEPRRQHRHPGFDGVRVRRSRRRQFAICCARQHTDQ